MKPRHKNSEKMPVNKIKLIQLLSEKLGNECAEMLITFISERRFFESDMQAAFDAGMLHNKYPKLTKDFTKWFEKKQEQAVNSLFIQSN